MPFELDHVFVAASVDAPEMQLLASAGFVAGATHDHPGQGTASRGVYFTNAYLELIWVADARAVRAPSIRRTHLAERADPTSTTCPFGFGLRSPVDPVPDPPFATWKYSPPYLPKGASFAMGANSRNLDEPLLFVLPWSRTASWTPPSHPNGALRVTRVGLVSSDRRPSEELAAFHGLGLVRAEEGPAPLLRIELDEGDNGGGLDLRPQLPIALRW